MPDYFLHVQGSYSFALFKSHNFPWLFPWPFQVFQDLRFSCQFQKFQTCTWFRAFFWLEQSNRHKLWRSPKHMLFNLLNYSSLSYIVLAFSSAVNNLSNRTLIFHDFQGLTIIINSMNFQAWKWNSYIPWLQVFHDLYEPWCMWRYTDSTTLGGRIVLWFAQWTFH